MNYFQYNHSVETGRYSQLFEQLSNNLNIFIQAVYGKKSGLLATDKWTVKDVLCHIVFWHENYAANYHALALNRPPPLLDGPGYKLNPEGVASFRNFSTPELINRLHQAQSSLYQSIVVNKVPQMTYKKGGRIYKTEDFLKVIARHLLTHTKQVNRAK
jgi:hypothetical protein